MRGVFGRFGKAYWTQRFRGNAIGNGALHFGSADVARQAVLAIEHGIIAGRDI